MAARSRRLLVTALGLAVAAASAVGALWTLRTPSMSGAFREVNGPGKLEFKGRRVYVTTLLGMTFVAEYEVDDDRVIILGAGGSQVYTRRGDALVAGAGLTFVRE